MNTDQLNHILNNDSASANNFYGTVACDRLPSSIVEFPIGICVNTAPSSDPGEHWIGLYLEQHGQLEIFCSFGSAPLVVSTCDWMKRFLANLEIKHVKWNQLALQPLTSSTCGLYVIFYILTRSRGHSLDDFIACFTNDATLNDETILLVWEKYKSSQLWL